MRKEAIAEKDWKTFLKAKHSSNTLGRRRILNALHGAQQKPQTVRELAIAAKLSDVATKTFLMHLKKEAVVIETFGKNKGFRLANDWKRPPGEVEPESPHVKEVITLALSTDGGKNFHPSVKLTLEVPVGCSIRVQQE
jgi:hypothetical protein